MNSDVFVMESICELENNQKTKYDFKQINSAKLKFK